MGGHDRRRAATVVLLAAVLAVSAVGPSPAIARAAKSSTHWDPRVVTYVRFVEQQRNLEFEHPVPVAFLDDKQFVKTLQADEPVTTKRDRTEAAHYAAQLRALGLIEGDVDLIQSEKDRSAAGVVGFYDDDRKKLFVRGRDLSDTEVRVTLVHELTHALQDQHFDLRRLDDKTATSGEDFALTALIEGDATSVEDAYLASLPQAERDAYDASFDESTPGSGERGTAADVPPILDLFDSAPYIFGPAYIDLLKSEEGRNGIDRAFAHPPVSEEQIIDPVAIHTKEAPARVPTPELAPGEKRDGSGDDFGALSLYLTLATRLDPATALRATEGWGGDRYVAFTKGADRRECVRVAFRGDTPGDTDEIASALDQWVAQLPPGAASLHRGSDIATLTACDTKGTTAPSQDTLEHSVSVLSHRNSVVLEFLGDGAPVDSARCISDRVVLDPDLTPLLTKESLTDDEDARLAERISVFTAACAS